MGWHVFSLARRLPAFPLNEINDIYKKVNLSDENVCDLLSENVTAGNPRAHTVFWIYANHVVVSLWSFNYF